MILFSLLFMLKSFGMGCDPLPSGSCTQPDGIDTCRIENGHYCSVSNGTQCSKVINNSGQSIFMGAKAGTNNWGAFHQNVPKGITTTTCSCEGGIKNWNVGASDCTASLPNMNDGESVTISDTVAPITGSATYSCIGTTVSGPSGVSCNSNVGCSLNLPASWTTTNAKGLTKTCTMGGTGAVAFNEGEQKTLAGGLPVAWGSFPTNGSITYLCSNGALTLVSQSCTADCTFKCNNGGSEIHQWSQAGNTCFCQGGPLETVPNGTSRSFGAANSNGTLTVSCNDGDFTYSGTCQGGLPN